MSALKILTQLVLRDLVKQKNLMLEFVGEAKKGIASLENLPILLKEAQAKASKLLQDAKSRGVDLTNLSADEIKKTYQFSKEVGHQQKMSITKPKVDMAETVKSEVIDYKGWNPKVVKGGKKEGVENLFEETKKVNMPAEKLNHQMIADQAGIDVELIKGKDWVEILEVLKGLKKADGGRIGYDIGGLTGQAKNIYDSWISAGHSSQDALDYLSSRGMYDVGGGGGNEGLQSIINTQQSIVPGGNQYNTTPIGTQIANFNQARADRQTRLENPNTIQSLINNYTGGGQRTVNKMLQSGNIGDFRKTQGLPFGIGEGIARMLPDKYYDLPVQDQAFIQSMMGFEDEGGMSNKDPFGINVRSMFGNYANYVRNINQKLAGREFKPGSWQDQRQKFYAEIEKDRVRQEEAAKAAAARDIALYAEAQRTGDADAASGAGGNVDPGGPASRMGWSDLTDDEGDKYATGGVATMFTRRR